MKKAKRIYILIAVLAVLSIAAFCVIHTTEKREDIRNSGTNILEIPTESLKSLSWKSNALDEALFFYKDEHWCYEKDKAFPVDDEKIEALVEQFEAFTADFVIEDVEDYSQYGLDAPIAVIKLSTADQDYEIHLGAYSEMDAERYVDIGDGNVYLMKHDPLEEFDAILSDVMKNDEIPLFETVNHVQFSGKENMNINRMESGGLSYRDEDVYYMDQGENKLPLDTSILESYLRKISHLKLEDYMTYNATDEEKKAYGLDQPEMEVSVNYTVKDDKNQETDQDVAIQIGRAPDAKNKKIEDVTEAYVKLKSSSIIYKITGDEYRELLNVSYDTLRHQEILPVDQENLKTIEIHLEGKKYTIQVENKKDEQKFYYLNEEMENTDCIKDMFSLKADGFTDQKADGKTEISFSVEVNKENVPRITVEILRYDADHCLAKVDGKTVAFVKREDVVKMIEAVNKIVLNTSETTTETETSESVH